MESIKKEDIATLLTLPRQDLDSKSKCNTLLLQLPPSWTVADLRDTKFVGSDSQQVALVSDTKEISFSCHHVETSNVWIMIPPADDTSSNSAKRTKTAQGKSLIPRKARLLKPGGSGASFLELREHSFDVLAALSSKLSAHVLDPYQNVEGVSGRTVESLANELQVSRAQIQRGLQTLEAFPIPRTSSFCRLGEEATLEAYHAIVSSLAEVEELQAYVSEMVPFDRAVDEALMRMDQFTYGREILQHCLQALSTELNHDDTLVRLSILKVAQCVARRLFQQQTHPWQETLFLSRWQTEIPGLAQVGTDMLRGIAICVEDKAGERFWKYLPSHILNPLDTESRCNLLFGAKDIYSADEIEPYLSVQDLLQFCRVEERDGSKYYVKRE